MRDTETASVARAVRTWKPGLSTSHWYLAPCSVLVMPEEHRKIWSFLGVHYAELFQGLLVSGSHLCGVFCDTTVSCSKFALGVQEYGFFWKTASGMLSVFSSPWFDSGYILGVSLRGLLASTLQELRILRSCSSSSVVDILFVPQRQIPMVQTVQQTAEIPQMPFVFRWSMPLLCRSCGSTGRSSPRRGAEAVPWSRLFVGPWVVFLWEMTSGLSPYSALSLVRQRIHALRQSTRLSGRFSHYFSWFLSVFSASLGSTMDTCLRQSMRFLEDFHILGPSYFSTMLGSTVDSCSYVRLRRL